MWEKASSGSQSVEKLILSNDKCLIINFACFFAHVLFSPFFLRECILFQMSLFWVKNFIKVRRKKLCSSNSDSGKLFQKLFPPKQSPGKEKNEKKSEGRGVERKRKGKVKTAVWLLDPKTIAKFCFLRMPKVRKLNKRIVAVIAAFFRWVLR